MPLGRRVGPATLSGPATLIGRATLSGPATLIGRADHFPCERARQDARMAGSASMLNSVKSGMIGQSDRPRGTDRVRDG